MSKSKIILNLLNRNFLVSPDFLEKFDNDYEIVDSLKSKISTKDKPLILNKDLLFVLKNGEVGDINWNEFEKSKSMF